MGARALDAFETAYQTREAASGQTILIVDGSKIRSRRLRIMSRKVWRIVLATIALRAHFLFAGTMRQGA